MQAVDTDAQPHAGAVAAPVSETTTRHEDASDAYDELAADEAIDRWRQCDLLATALAEYNIDGRAAVTMPLLAVARDPRDAALLPDLARTVHRLGQAVDANAGFLDDVLDACPGLREFVSGDGNSDESSDRPTKRVRAHDQSTQPLEWSSPEREQHREDVRCVLKQLAREWSEDGAEERRRIHSPVLEALVKYVPAGHESINLDPTPAKAANATAYRRGSNQLAAVVNAALLSRRSDNRSATADHSDHRDSGGGGCEPLVLVPGSGLGRLACEISGIVGPLDSASSGSVHSNAEEPKSASVCGYAVEACESGAVMSAVAELIIGLASEQREQQWRSVLEPSFVVVC